MTDFSQLLNPEQCAAATAADGPLLVLAAAGTGKTRTLVHRVAYLVERGVPAERILLLTFTNRAAREMLERARQVSGDAVAAIWSGTFHSICARFLRRYGTFLGFEPSFQILDEDDQKKLIGDIIKSTVSNPKDFPKKEIVAKMISEAANEEREISDIASRWQTKVASVEPEEIVKVAELYAKRKLELGAMDFDDLLVNGLKLVKDKAEVRELLQEHFLHVLVDEYQDTNGLQAEFTDILAAKHRNLMAVGDDFQCIYTWRGAQISNIMEFPNRWQGCKIVKLERNYRSVPGILEVANAVMKDAPKQFEKVLRPTRTDSLDKPALSKVYDDEVQASEMVRTINQLRDLGYRYRDIAVLYRSHFQSIKIQMMLTKMRLPFRITSGIGVFEQLHVKDILAYLRLLVQPTDELSFLRFLCLLPGVGEKGATKIWEKLSHRFDSSRAEDREAVANLLSAKAKPYWKVIAKCFEAAVEQLEVNAVGEIIEDFCDLYYEEHLNREWVEADATERLNDIKELASQIANNEKGLKGFLADVALLTNLDDKRLEHDADEVTLSTVHQAKGMEWPVVMVPWLSEGMFPSGKATEEGRMDEERRLFYVALTRAKDQLYLYSPQIRKMADGGVFPVEPSIFLQEIPEELLEVRRALYNPLMMRRW